MAVAKQKPAQKKKSAIKKAAPKKAPKKKAAVKKAVTKTAAKKKAEVKKVAPKKAGKKPTMKTTVKALEDFTPYKEKSGEHYMNKNQIAHFRNLLENWKRDLMEEVDRTVHHMQDDAANFPDPNDRATQESEFALELRTRDRERKLIKKIDESLENLDNDEYGYCEVCGVEIGIRRLEARPTATLCIDCKTLDEIREKQMRG
jgi:RNA polymerase-binding transcription factor